jgi:hypothetical protein
VRRLGGKVHGDLFQLIQGGRQEIAVVGDPMDPPQLFGAGKKRFERGKRDADAIDQFAHPRRTHAGSGEGGFDAFPQVGFRRCGLHHMAGKMKDDAPAGEKTGLAKFCDRMAKQRPCNQRLERPTDFRFAEPEPFGVAAMVRAEHVCGLVKQRPPMIGVQGDLGTAVRTQPGLMERRQPLAFQGRQIL